MTQDNGGGTYELCPIAKWFSGQRSHNLIIAAEPLHRVKGYLNILPDKGISLP